MAEPITDAQRVYVLAAIEAGTCSPSVAAVIDAYEAALAREQARAEAAEAARNSWHEKFLAISETWLAERDRLLAAEARIADLEVERADLYAGRILAAALDRSASQRERIATLEAALRDIEDSNNPAYIRRAIAAALTGGSP